MKDQYIIFDIRPAAFRMIHGRRLIDCYMDLTTQADYTKFFAIIEAEEQRKCLNDKFDCKIGITPDDIINAHPDAEFSIITVDNKALAAIAREVRYDINNKHMDCGVIIIEPITTYIDHGVKIGTDTVIYPGAIIEGDTTIGTGCTIGPNSRLVNMKIGNNVKIEQSTCMDGEIDDGTSFGPYSFMRNGAKIGKNCRIGCFVEMKNVVFGDESKASHLNYIGDATFGRNVNFGCGAITVNYDGKTKSQTTVEDDAFVGCNVNLIAPVTIGKGAFVAAGSTINKDVPPAALAIARQRQTNKEGWVKP